MKYVIHLFVLLFASVVLKAQTNSFPDNGPAAIGLTNPFTRLDILGGIDINHTGRTFVAPYYIGYANDICGGQPAQYILLAPIFRTGSGYPSSGLSGILTCYRGSDNSYNFNGEYKISFQSAYSANWATITPLNDNSKFLNVYQVDYQGATYAAVKTSEILCSAFNVNFTGHWWNNVNTERPKLVLESEVTNSSVLKAVQPIFGNIMFADQAGRVSIGTTDAQGYKFAVAGAMIAERIKVKPAANWPDYVFDKNYPLTSLAELDRYINEHKHLPEIPSAKEIANDGQDLGEMNRKLLQKIEELTLYILQQQQQLESQNNRIQKLEQQR